MVLIDVLKRVFTVKQKVKSLMSCFHRASWRFLQGLAWYWGLRWVVGSISHSDMKSHSFSRDVFCLQQYPSTCGFYRALVSADFILVKYHMILIIQFKVYSIYHNPTFVTRMWMPCDWFCYCLPSSHRDRHVCLSHSYIDAVPSQNSFLRLCTRIKILLICFVVFTMSSGLGFLDATLSIFAIEKVHL